jgi:hypothetical protein
MAATKLTLRLDDRVIRKGKAYARQHNTSLSKLFEAYLKDKIEAEAKKQRASYKPIKVIEVSDKIRSIGFPSQDPKRYDDDALYREYVENLAKETR